MILRIFITKINALSNSYRNYIFILLSISTLRLHVLIQLPQSQNPLFWLPLVLFYMPSKQIQLVKFVAQLAV